MSNIISQLQLEFSELIEDVKVKNLFNGHGIFIKILCLLYIKMVAFI
ncbi:Uncharacterised protein [Aggregatibacter aphrophilus]|uniref:Uncharacterized protein n=1 Tax=Aggregatibacter aphrophilus TaxID=732 RepID=A0A336N902_AGGAP|nr:Uncharacterised protein [Aggregatibacter aphrophilus]